MIKNAVWFITGCSHGLGKTLAKTLLEQNHKVVATARTIHDLDDLQSEYSSDQLLILELDVTNKQQITQSVSTAIETFGRIDILVNNAGSGIIGAIEEVPENELRQIFEVNFFGIFNLIQAVLPHMRKQHSGYIMNISGIAGSVSTQGIGAYNASKFAVSGLTEALHQELEPLGIHVTLIEPGPLRTGFFIHSVRSCEKISEYNNTRGFVANAIRQYDGKEPGDPALVAKSIIALAGNPVPPLHLPMGKFAVERLREKSHQLNDAILHSNEYGKIDFQS